MKTNFLKLIPMIALCAIALGSCSECCTYLTSDGMKVKVCKNEATQYDWTQLKNSCESGSNWYTGCDCD